MNINSKLDLYKNSLSNLKLSEKQTSAAMRSTVTSPEEQTVAMNLATKKEKDEKEEFLRQQRARKANKQIEVIDPVNPDDLLKKEGKFKVERDPVKLLKLIY